MRLHLPIALRWGDLDAFNHVNNVSLLKVLEEARVRALWAPTTAAEDVPPTAVIGPGGGGETAATLTLIARQEIEYLAPLSYRREPVDVQLWFSTLGGASFDICYEVTEGAGTTTRSEAVAPVDQQGTPPTDDLQRQATVYARAMASVVLVDATSMRPRKIRATERAAWTPYLGEPIRFRRR